MQRFIYEKTGLSIGKLIIFYRVKKPSGGVKMAVPKRKTSKARRDKRRSNVWKLEMPGMVKCAHCGEYVLAHRVCKACGYYDGKQIIAAKEA